MTDGMNTTRGSANQVNSMDAFVRDSLTPILAVFGVIILLLVVSIIVLFFWVRSKLRVLHLQNQVLEQDVLMLKENQRRSEQPRHRDEQKVVYRRSPEPSGSDPADMVIANVGSDENPPVQPPDINVQVDGNLGLSPPTSPVLPGPPGIIAVPGYDATHPTGIPRYSILHENQEFNAYTSAIGSQLYPIVQSVIWESGDEPEKRITVQEVEIVPLYADSFGNKLTTRQPELGGPALRPKSIMWDRPLPTGAAAAPTQPFPGMFVQKTIGPTGGTVSLCGVRLKIPAGALGEEQDIRLGILSDTTYYPKLSRKECLLSPVISCTPHGLTFKTPVELTIPHCAEAITQDWNFHIQKSETEIAQAVQWENLTLDDVDSRTVTEEFIELKLKHFTLYTFVGESGDQKVAAKKVTLVAFSPPLKGDNLFKIRVYCVNHYEEKEKETVESSEAALGGTLADSPKPMLFHDGGADLCINITNIGPKGWSLLQGDVIEELSFEAVWHAFLPNCSFTLKSDSALEEVMCTLLGYQKGRESRQQKIHISQRQQKAISRSESIPGNTVFPSELRRQLIIHLDIPDPLNGRDWHALAEELKLRYVDIRWLESKDGTTGPTEHLLREWDKQKKSLDDFKQAMNRIKRPDVVQEIEDFMNSPASKA